MIYANFASVYDRLMRDVPYREWVSYLHRMFENHGIKPVDILDIGCGTGNVTLPLAEMGYRLTGLDLSPDMLAVADEKARTRGLPIRWIQQDMREMDLGGETFDLIVSMTDSLNYISAPEELKAVFDSCRKLLRAGGWFIFDLNSLYKISTVFGNNVYTLADEDIAYIWENSFDPETRRCRMFLTFFVSGHDGMYRRFSEEHCETGYDADEVCRILEEAGFTVQAVYGENSFAGPGPKEERLYFLARA